MLTNIYNLNILKTCSSIKNIYILNIYSKYNFYIQIYSQNTTSIKLWENVIYFL